ncbi:hypothetical protein EJB05_34045 [Eragrostis curvula]|uniref:Uncharacterized protein n=1 Tax=Eragrostis curvula TaxID=38414 RepID=A0A5J9U2P2_9POAL|nr:hypothetical protein EJB05_34045 [Eragrostis curvula]
MSYTGGVSSVIRSEIVLPLQKVGNHRTRICEPKPPLAHLPMTHVVTKYWPLVGREASSWEVCIGVRMCTSDMCRLRSKGNEGPWMLQDFNNGEDYVNDDEDSNTSALTKRKFEWDCDDENVIDNECCDTS